MLVSQELFDETLLESQELFEYDDEEAVQSTISELESAQNGTGVVRLDHLSLTHPNSKQGQTDRQHQKHFVQALQEENLSAATQIIANAVDANSSTKKPSPMFPSLVLQHGLLQSGAKLVQWIERDNEQDIQQFVQFLLSMLPEALTAHSVAREVKLQLARILQEKWLGLYEEHVTLRAKLLKFARLCCNGCESNKKTLVQSAIRFQAKTLPLGGSDETNGIALLLSTLPRDVSGDREEEQMLAKEICKLIVILGKFQASSEPPPQDGQPPVVSSAHANVKELHKCGAVNRLHGLAKQCSKDDTKEELLCDSLAALRVMAIDNDIVQNMVAVGVLETTSVTASTEDGSNEGGTDSRLLVSHPATAAATLGLLRNLCANDEIKCTICKQSLPAILHAMESHQSNAVVQEHGCGILAAMSLRQPHNAKTLCDARAHDFILAAMRSFPNKVPLQRQSCLALRNMACRSSAEDKQIILDAGAEFALKSIAARHQESIDEAYAALRDLGCSAVMYKVDETGKAQGTQLFGKIQSNFRPVYD